MDAVIEYARDSNYTSLIVAVIALAGVICTFLKIDFQFKHLFRLYFFGFLLIMVLNYLNFYHNSINSQYSIKTIVLQQQVDFLFTLFEYYVFRKVLIKELNKITVQIADCLMVFGSTIVYSKIITSENFANDQALLNLFTVQAISLIIISVAHIAFVFRNQLDLILVREPTFWVATGVSFFSLSTLPFSIFSGYLYQTQITKFYELFSIFNVFYVLLFLMIIKALLCRPTIAK